MSDDPTPEEFADPANWHPIEEHPYLNDPPNDPPMSDLRDRIAAKQLAHNDLCKCGHRAHRHDNFGLGRCCHHKECGCPHFNLAVRWRGGE